MLHLKNTPRVCAPALLAGLALAACGDDKTSADTATVPDGACTVPAEAASDRLLAFEVGDMTRQFRLYAPAADAGVALPVVLAFHGGGGRDWPFPQEQQFAALAEEAGVIIAYPLAELVLPNEGEWILNTTEDNDWDIDFVDTLIDKLSANYCVDDKRIYATGYSLGSMFTYELACQLNDRFAAIASFAGTMPVSPASCVLEDNVPILHLHGESDSIIAYGNQWDWKEWDSVGTMMSIPELVDYWQAANNCQSESESPTGSGTHYVYDDCDGGVRVEHHKLSGRDHDWPSTINEVSTHQVIWDFLSDFSKP